MITEGIKKPYTPARCMDLFDISRPTFNEWCKAGVFEKISIPGMRRVFVTAESVEKLLHVKQTNYAAAR